MLTSTFILPLLAATLSFAAPAKKQGSKCDVSKATLSGLPSPLAAPTHKTTFIGLGVGTQNYTCGTAGTYVSAGAVAEVFDISCLYGKQGFDQIADVAMKAWSAAPSSITVSKLESFMSKIPNLCSGVLGQHYFIPNGAATSPKWDFTSASFKGNANAYVVGAKVNNAAAPTGKQDVDWLQLKQASGSLADEIYRTDTRLGQPPASCTAGSAPITVKYVSKYYFMGGSM